MVPCWNFIHELPIPYLLERVVPRSLPPFAREPRAPVVVRTTQRPGKCDSL
ncbi:hypothetical protein SAMN05892883_1593 [Jatrophihabitans sp. GAS493]|nr:hypothetical protein SAMN05892883_1593 [Jatrophihabitans sp. GAS493]